MIKLRELIKENIFLHGLCFEFAIALNHIVGGEIGVVVGEFSDEFGEEGDVYEIFSHAFVYATTDQNLGIDVNGSRPISDMIEDSVFNDTPKRVIHRKTSEQELRATVDIDDDSINKAKLYIQQHKHKFWI